MVLVAMASAAPAAGHAEGRCGLAEPTSVRAMAAVVAAVARDMIGLERPASAAITSLPVAGTVPEAPSVAASEAPASLPRPAMLAERLLDLPPPLA
jgi:hypothetical protein